MQEVDSSLTSCQVLVVGGGVVGCAAAHAMAEEGYHVTVIERCWERPERIVGELLQPGGIKKLEAIGMGDVFDYNNTTINGYVIIGGEKLGTATLKYSQLSKQLGLTENPIGRGIHHGDLVQSMRRKLLAHENITCIHGNFKDLVKEDGVAVGAKYSPMGGVVSVLPVVGEETKEKGELITISATTTLICDGCTSNFRNKVEEIPKGRKISSFFGVVMKDDPENSVLPHPNHGHVILAEPSPILMYQIGGTDIRILVDIPGTPPRGDDLDKYMRGHVCSQLPETVRPAFIEAMDSQRFFSMPNNYIPPRKVSIPGAFMLGDAYNQRHPLTGGGMTVGFSDVVAFRDVIRRNTVGAENATGAAREDVLETLRDVSGNGRIAKEWRAERRNLAMTINILANALYGCFSSEHSSMPLRIGLMSYLRIGGENTRDPVGFLSGLAIDTQLLVKHFFAVAWHGAKLYATSPITAIIILYQATAIILPYLINEVLRTM